MADVAFKEPDTVTDEHHVMYRRVIDCGAPGCRARAHRWARCRGCRKLVARCGAHEHRFEDTVRAHC